MLAIFALIALTFIFTAPVYSGGLDRVKEYFLSGDYKSAIAEGEKVMATSGQSAPIDELYYILGLSYLKEGNYLRASDIFEIIINEFKGSRFRTEASLGLGDTYFLRNDYEKARQIYSELINNKRQSKLTPLVYYRLSQCASKSGNMQEAKNYQDKIKQEFPLSLEANYNMDPNSIVADFYTVQVGSFSKNSNANNLKEKLAGKGFPAYVDEVTLEDKVSYRVRVGRFSSRQEAAEVENKLSQEGYPTKVCP